MAQIAKSTTKQLLEMLQSPVGMRYSVAALAEQEDIILPALEAAQITGHCVPQEIAERSAALRYPSVYVYCDRVVNDLREKFRMFSGKVHLTIELRQSHDRLEDLESRLQLYVDSVLDVLDRNRGNWENGMFFSGEYEVAFSPVKHGGKNYLKVAKIGFDVNVSRE